MSEEIIPLDESVVSVEAEEVVIDQNGSTVDINNNTNTDIIFKCGICDYSTERKFNYECHTMVHSSQRGKKHSCDECGHNHTDASKLRDHMKVVHDGEYFLCVHCGKNYKSKDGLRKHEHIKHKIQGKYECLTCHQAFLSRSVYIGHMAKHSGTKPFQCTSCKTEFRYEANLKRHCDCVCSGVHEKSKQFRCECGSRYNWRSSLSYHRRKCPFQN